jgi:uncharacterized protein (DUF2235 family)
MLVGIASSHRWLPVQNAPENKESSAMEKNIILSSDGTGNSGGKGHGTNVWRLHTALDRYGHRDCENLRPQIAFYDDGVGTERKKLLKLAGGAFGLGLTRNIRELYTFLVNNYEPGDRIYLFGFSRGAYTVRLLAGLITTCGILKRDHYSTDRALRKDIKSLYRSYKKAQFSTGAKSLLESLGMVKIKPDHAHFRASNVHSDRRIEFMGVWDTVDAYAIPSDTLAEIIQFFFFVSFRDKYNSLSPLVGRACHALAVDDERRTFHPVLWREENDEDHERIDQVWFPGSHSNVGGGYPKQGMSWVSLEWMMDHARNAGLRFVKEDVDQFRENKDATDKLYDSRAGLGAYYTYKVRDIGALLREFVSKETVPRIHISLFERINKRSQGYAPGNLPRKFELVTSPHNRHYKALDIQALQDQVNRELDAENLLSRHNVWRGFKGRSTYIFVFGTLAIWGLFLYMGLSGGEDIPSLISWMFVIWFAYWLIVVIASWYALTKIENTQSSFWRKLLKGTEWNFLD